MTSFSITDLDATNEIATFRRPDGTRLRLAFRFPDMLDLHELDEGRPQRVWTEGDRSVSRPFVTAMREIRSQPPVFHGEIKAALCAFAEQLDASVRCRGVA